jgi:ABC-2 type transport system permease protein
LIFFVAFASGGIAIFVVGISKSESAVDLVSNVFVQISAALGGGMIPLQIMSESLNLIAMGTVNWWAYKGFESLMLGGNIISILPFCGVLGGVGVIFITIGLITFRVE